MTDPVFRGWHGPRKGAKPLRRDPALKLFKLFGVMVRLIVFQRIARHPQTATEIAKELPVSRSAIVQHLSALRAAGQVDVRSEGRRRIYFSSPQGLAPLAHWLRRHGGAETPRVTRWAPSRTID